MNGGRTLSPLDQRGSAVVLVVAIGTLVSLLVFSWVTIAIQRSRGVALAAETVAARCAAESAISKAVYQRMTDGEGSILIDEAEDEEDEEAHEEEEDIDMDEGEEDDEETDVEDESDTFGMGKSVDLNAERRRPDTVAYTDSLHHTSGKAIVDEDGVYLRVKATGKAGRSGCEIEAGFGLNMPPAFRSALILSEQNQQLVIRGGRVIGDARLAQRPLGGIDGKVITGVAELPPVATERFDEAITRLQDRLHARADTVFQGSQVFQAERLPVTAGEALFVNGNILIQSGRATITGPLTIIASGDIQLSGALVLEKVTLLSLGSVKCFDSIRLLEATVYAQNAISLEDEVRCSGTLFAMENLLLAGSARVDMPSFAYVNGALSGGAPVNRCGIQITRRSRFSGTVFCEDATTFSLIGREARFSGLFYTQGFLTLEGTVYGCVAARRLKRDILDDANELYGGTIDRRRLPDNFVIPIAFRQDGGLFSLVSWSEKVRRERKGGTRE